MLTSSLKTVQTTRAQDFLEMTWVCGRAREDLMKDAHKRIVRHTHYRMTSDVVGYSLRTLSGTSELLKTTYGAFTGE